jgi:hypothetical protein
MVCHPKDKTFFVTVNSAGKTPNSSLSIVELDDSEHKNRLSSKSIPYSDFLEKAVFLRDASLMAVSRSSTGQTGIALLTEQATVLKPTKSFDEHY